MASESGLELVLRPHAFRFAAYSLLVGLLVVCIVLTRMFTVPAGALDLEDNVLINTFGYNNICVYIDDLPAKYVAIWLWCIFVIAWWIYEGLMWVQIRGQYRLGLVSEGWYRAFLAITIFDVLGVSYSISIFAVHPKQNFVMHTIPFSALIVVVSLNAFRNIIFGLDDVAGTGFGYSAAGLSRGSRWSMYAYLVLLLANSVAKITFQFQGIVKNNPPPVWLGRANDIFWTVLALLVPWARAGYVVTCGKEGTLPVRVAFKPGVDPALLGGAPAGLSRGLSAAWLMQGAL